MKNLIYFSCIIFFTLSCGKDSGNSKSTDVSIETKEVLTSSQDETQISPVLSVEEKYLNLLNEYRAKLNLKSLKLSENINNVCYGHSSNMANKKVWFGHTGFSSRCSELKNYFPQMNLCGEVVANGQDDEEEVLKAWINSYSHRLTLEGDRYTHTGIAWSEDSSGKKYWTQIFIEDTSYSE
jgi:uncharacterized protein YkwD